MGILKFVGRGSMFNVKEGNTSAYWKTDDGETMLLIDCGCTVFQRIMQLELLEGVERLVILITHTHSDHIGSLSDLLFYCKFCKPELEVYVFSTTDNHRLSLYLDTTGFQIGDCTSNPHVIYVENTNESPMNFSGTLWDHIWFTFRFIEENHTVYHRGDKRSISYGIELHFMEEDKTIYYSGDTQSINNVDINLDEIDELYVDSAVRLHSPGSDSKYPHCNVFDTVKYLKEKNFPLNKTYAIHLDCDGVIDICNQFGINVVENEEE